MRKKCIENFTELDKKYFDGEKLEREKYKKERRERFPWSFIQSINQSNM